jgi:hypothetical protein
VESFMLKRIRFAPQPTDVRFLEELLLLKQLDGGEWLRHTPVALLLEKQSLAPGG